MAGKTRELNKLENRVQNQSFGSIVGAQRTTSPRDCRRDNTAGIMTTSRTSPPYGRTFTGHHTAPSQHIIHRDRNETVLLQK